MVAADSSALSVVVPAFNEEDYLEETVGAIRTSAGLLRDQTRTATELIVVDDQSTDGTGHLASLLADRVVPGPGTTIAAARNAGAAHATGHVLVFIDADTVIEPAVLLAIDTVVRVGSLAGSIRSAYTSPRRSVRLLLRLWDWYAPRHDITQGVCQFFERNLFHELGGYRTDLLMAEDTDLYHRAQRHAPGRTHGLSHVTVSASMRRYEQVPALRLWWQMNPITTRFFRRSSRLWRDWYVNPPR